MGLQVDFNKTKNKQEAYAAVKEAITPELLSRFKVKADITYKAESMSAKGKGFKLDLEFSENTCSAELTLSLILRPLKKAILDGIEKQLNRVI